MNESMNFGLTIKKVSVAKYADNTSLADIETGLVQPVEVIELEENIPVDSNILKEVVK